jgi:hypothetical protein
VLGEHELSPSSEEDDHSACGRGEEAGAVKKRAR